MLKIYWLAGVCLVASVEGSARAQVAGSASVVPPAGDEIVVTARRRAETLRDVPIAITAVSGATLERQGVTQTRELFSSTPGLYFSQSGQRQNDEQFSVTIRGVGSSPVVEPSVGLFIDGIYVPSLGWTSEFLDLERVEILRGPQGALFGRNTEGGAISIITRKPDDTLRGRLSAEVGNLGTYRTSAVIAGPLTSNVYLGLSGFASTTNGFIHNVTLDKHEDNKTRAGGRATLRVVPSDTLEVIASADYTQSRGGFDPFGDPVSHQKVSIADPNAGPLQGVSYRDNILTGPRYVTYGQTETRVHTKNYGAGLTVNATFGDTRLTSISGYRNVSSRDQFDQDAYTPAFNTNTNITAQRILSQELRLASTGGGGLQWVVGGYGFRERLLQDRLSIFDTGLQINPLPPAPDGFVSDGVMIHRTGVAAFGQVSYKVTPKLELSLSARYSHEHVRQNPDLNVRVLIYGFIPVVLTNTAEASKSFQGFSPSGSISYKLTPSANIYATVSTGLKGGGFPKEIPNTAAQNVPLKNETSLNYEAGFKGDLFDRKATLNAALFYTTLRDQQLSTLQELQPGSGVLIPSTLNVGKGHAEGVELEGVVRPLPGIRLNGSLSYTHTRFDRYIAQAATATTPAYDRQGQSFPESPKWLASASAEYDVRVASDMVLTPMLSWRHVGAEYTGEGNISSPFVPISSFDLFDAQLTLVRGPWSLTGYVKNLTDKYYFTFRSENQPVVAVPGIASFGRPGAPRTFGLRASYQF